MKKERVLVSACLLGYPIRHNGSDKKISDELIDRLKDSAEVISACPEMLGGLPCPRLPSEQQSHTGKVIASNGRDISVFFRLGAHETLNICKNYGIRVAVLKSKSPSCGKGFIYDGSFTGQLTQGEGITSRLLSENGIEIFNESEVRQAIEKIRGK